MRGHRHVRPTCGYCPRTGSGHPHDYPDWRHRNHGSAVGSGVGLLGFRRKHHRGHRRNRLVPSGHYRIGRIYRSGIFHVHAGHADYFMLGANHQRSSGSGCNRQWSHHCRFIHRAAAILEGSAVHVAAAGALHNAGDGPAVYASFSTAIPHATGNGGRDAGVRPRGWLLGKSRWGIKGFNHRDYAVLGNRHQARDHCERNHHAVKPNATAVQAARPAIQGARPFFAHPLFRRELASTGRFPPAWALSRYPNRPCFVFR